MSIPPPLFPKNPNLDWTSRTDIVQPELDIGKGQLPSISLITPSFNQAEYLETTIRSVLLQGYPKLEYVVIDGGSSDDSKAIIEYYAYYLSFWVSEEDRGQSHAINKGFAQCTGELINWINSDDLLMPNALWVLAHHWQKNQGFDILMGAQLHMKPNKKQEVKARIHQSSALPVNVERALYLQPCTFFKRELLGSPMVNENLNYIMDWEMFARFISQQTRMVCYTDEVLAGFRFHETSKSVSEAEKFSEEKIMLYHILAEQYAFNELQNALPPAKKKSYPLSMARIL